MVTVLSDHRRFGAVTMRLVAAGALLIATPLAMLDRVQSLKGLLAGAMVAEIDCWLLGRSLTRFSHHADRIGARALTVMMMTRFLAVSGMVGAVVCMQGVDPLGVVTGFLLFPAGIAVAGMASLRADSRRGLRDAAR